ncbi:hypothetical protein Poly41_69250 [Novipirellula artificiosorum]|uniref:Uncharacterized protein n=1 Tax=Novipirellula artificiosorum TaxID=2528016 RepID=A0A5C6CZD4_9BACT|nr:hypothetical protein Poly41_69250 [Novipirellula artificiosorum]
MKRYVFLLVVAVLCSASWGDEREAGFATTIQTADHRAA